MSKTNIYIELSAEIEKLLNDNKIEIIDILKQDNIDAEVTKGMLPYQLEDGARSKDIVPRVQFNILGRSHRTCSHGNCLKILDQRLGPVVCQVFPSAI